MISTQPALVLVLAPAAVALGVSAVYASLRPRPVIAELFLYIGLWLALPVLGVRLSYLAATAGYPPRDKLFSAVDAALGFRWIEWVAFVGRHPWIEAAQRLAYDSHFWQPLATVAILALWGPPGRNREMLTAMLLATIATIAISALLPALGPAHAHGYATLPAQIVQDLRAGVPGPYPYAGIVWFPSLHTAMSVLFTLAHRGNRWTFPPFLALNLLMLSAIPYTGNHYLADVLGGAGMAALAFVGARALAARRSARPAAGAGGIAGTA